MTKEISLKKMQKLIDEIEALGEREYYGIECPKCKNRCFGTSYDNDKFIKFYCDKCDQPYKVNKTVYVLQKLRR